MCTVSELSSRPSANRFFNTIFVVVVPSGATVLSVVVKVDRIDVDVMFAGTGVGVVGPKSRSYTSNSVVGASGKNFA